MKIMPKIINYGFYDASLIYGDAPTTNLRRTSMYEFEYITEDGGKSYIEDRVFPIRKGGIILGKARSAAPYRSSVQMLIRPRRDRGLRALLIA